MVSLIKDTECMLAVPPSFRPSVLSSDLPALILFSLPLSLYLPSEIEVGRTEMSGQMSDIFVPAEVAVAGDIFKMSPLPLLSRSQSSLHLASSFFHSRLSIELPLFHFPVGEVGVVVDPNEK